LVGTGDVVIGSNVLRGDAHWEKAVFCVLVFENLIGDIWSCGRAEAMGHRLDTGS